MADYISRDYTVENMENYPWDTEHDKNAAIHFVRELVPAADVRPVVRGKWIRRSDDSCVATCSVCGKENHYAFCIMSLAEQSLVQQDMFCPFCGADMIEDKGDYKDV